MRRKMQLQLTGFELKRIHELAWSVDDPNALEEPDKIKVATVLSAERKLLDSNIPVDKLRKAILWVNEDGSKFVEVQAIGML